jgi:hypothetical protein
MRQIPAEGLGSIYADSQIAIALLPSFERSFDTEMLSSAAFFRAKRASSESKVMVTLVNTKQV